MQAAKVCLQEKVILIDPVGHVRIMPREKAGDYHIYISDWTNGVTEEMEAYKYAVCWWARAADNIMQLIYAVFPDTVWEAQHSGFPIASRCLAECGDCRQGARSKTSQRRPRRGRRCCTPSFRLALPTTPLPLHPSPVDPSVVLRQADPEPQLVEEVPGMPPIEDPSIAFHEQQFEEALLRGNLGVKSPHTLYSVWILG